MKYQQFALRGLRQGSPKSSKITPGAPRTIPGCPRGLQGRPWGFLGVSSAALGGATGATIIIDPDLRTSGNGLWRPPKL